MNEKRKRVLVVGVLVICLLSLVLRDDGDRLVGLTDMLTLLGVWSCSVWLWPGWAGLAVVFLWNWRKFFLRAVVVALMVFSAGAGMNLGYLEWQRMKAKRMTVTASPASRWLMMTDYPRWYNSLNDSDRAYIEVQLAAFKKVSSTPVDDLRFGLLVTSVLGSTSATDVLKNNALERAQRIFEDRLGIVHQPDTTGFCKAVAKQLEDLERAYWAKVTGGDP